MKKSIIYLVTLLFILAFSACEKETEECNPLPTEVLGTWVQWHQVDDVLVNDFYINGHTYKYTMEIQNLNQGIVVTMRDAKHYKHVNFYLTVDGDSMFIMYPPGISIDPLLPPEGWSKYQQFDNTLLISHQIWRREE